MYSYYRQQLLTQLSEIETVRLQHWLAAIQSGESIKLCVFVCVGVFEIGRLLM